MPRTFVALYNAFKAGDYDTARQLQFKADDAIAVYLRYNVIAGVKAALTEQGFDAVSYTHLLKAWASATIWRVSR